MRGVEQRSSCGSTRTARGHGQREREQPAVCGARIVAPALPRSDALNYHLISDLRSAHQAALDELFSQMLAVALWPALAYNLTRALTMGWLWAQCATHGAGCPPAAGQNAAPPDPQTHSLSRSERAKLIHSQAASAAKHDRENQSVYAIGASAVAPRNISRPRALDTGEWRWPRKSQRARRRTTELWLFESREAQRTPVNC